MKVLHTNKHVQVVLEVTRAAEATTCPAQAFEPRLSISETFSLFFTSSVKIFIDERHVSNEASRPSGSGGLFLHLVS